MSKETRVALYGGAFNPPHLAHIFTVTYLLGRPDVDEVWLIPTSQHVFGKHMIAVDERLDLMNTLIDAYGWTDTVRVLDIEARRAGPSRTFDTLTHLTQECPDHTFRWVFGADNLTERHRWFRFDELVARWSLIVLGRPGHEAALEACAHEPWCEPGPTLPAISSTELRDAVAGRASAEHLRWLPDAIRGRVMALYAEAADEPLKICVLGYGRMGRTWSSSLRRAGHDVVTWNRSSVDGVDVTGDLVIPAHTQVVMIAVADTGIAEVAQMITETLGADQRPLVLHSAGRLSSDVLSPLKALGCAVGSLHPLQSVKGGASDLSGAFCVFSGDAAGGTLARALAQDVGGRFVELPIDDKAAYHAAAVLSANFMTTLSWSGVQLLTAIGLDSESAQALLHPLAHGTINHLSHAKPGDALTGPLARGDMAAIGAHIAALTHRAPELIATYRALARLTAQMLEWSDEMKRELEDALKS